jgi:hypothetical protein
VVALALDDRVRPGHGLDPRRPRGQLPRDDQRPARARAYTAEVVNAPAIAEADAAWQARDYALVCELLRPIRGELDDTHRRRLVFAESRLERAG